LRILDEVSRTLNEYLLVPNLTTADCTNDNVDLGVALVRHRRGETPAIRVATPLTSAIMGAVSSPRLAVALAQCGGLSFVHQNQSVEDQAAMVAAVKRHKAGFRYSDINIKPSATLGEVTALLETAERDVAVVTDDGSPHGLFVGLISTDDLHPRRHDLNDTVESRMRPAADLVTAPPTVSLSEANTLIWDHRLDVLPVVDGAGLLHSIVLRRVMLGRYFARFDESPAPLVRVGGQFFKEYWGEGSNRARNVTRYEHGGGRQLAFEEGVDGYVPYAGSLYDNVDTTIAKLKATMISCGATTLRDFHDNAVLVPVSQQSFLQNSAEVQLRDRQSGTGR
jgi:IMP dehydrogenase/GMP reductase